MTFGYRFGRKHITICHKKSFQGVVTAGEPAFQTDKDIILSLTDSTKKGLFRNVDDGAFVYGNILRNAGAMANNAVFKADALIDANIVPEDAIAHARAPADPRVMADDGVGADVCPLFNTAMTADKARRVNFHGSINHGPFINPNMRRDLLAEEWQAYLAVQH